MNWTNIMSSKGQVYAKKAVDFISKTEGPVYFEQVGTLKENIKHIGENTADNLTTSKTKRYSEEEPSKKRK